MGKSVYSICKWIISICFFGKKQIIDQLPFAQSANGKQIKKNHLGFFFWFPSYLFFLYNIRIPNILITYLHVLKPLSPCFHVSIDTLLQMENGSLCLFAANKKWNSIVSFVCCKQRWKTKVSFHWSANDKR